MDRIVTPYLSERKSLSVITGVILDHQRWVFSYPSGAVADAQPGDLIFEIGSITKLFTATLLGSLVLSGDVSLDDPINNYLPERGRVPPPYGDEITLLQLATHTSGLPRLPRNLGRSFWTRNNPYANYDAEQLYQGLSGYRASKPPAPYSYSNLGYGLLGHALSLRLRIPYEDAIDQRICLPLGMKDTLISLSSEQARRAMSGHSPRGNVVPSWDFLALEGCGALRSTANDLLKFMLANIEAETPLWETMKLCSIPRVTISRNSKIGLGWHITELGEQELIWHNGATGGFNSFLGLVRERGVGLCVLANCGLPLMTRFRLGRALADDIALQALRSFLLH